MSRLESALREFEAIEANLRKLETLAHKLDVNSPSPPIIGSVVPEYEDSLRSYERLLNALPKIDGWKPSTLPLDFSTIGQIRFEAWELSEPGVISSTEEMIEQPVRELREYRYKFNLKRRQLIRESVLDSLSVIDQLLRDLLGQYDDSASPKTKITDEKWEDVKNQVAVVDTLLGSSVSRPEAWNNLHRHLRFGQLCDLVDIAEHDWPTVKHSLSTALYSQDDPLPVSVGDIGELVRSQPSGLVLSRLNWEALSATDFERLLFVLISSAPGYENPEWLMNTSASDRGRDLSVYRVLPDALAGTTRRRVILQCKHWLSRTVNTGDIAHMLVQMTHWTPPRIEVLVIATSGRFSADAVDVIERHNQSDKALTIEMWPESHLERLIASRPNLIAEFNLRV